jgi:hypothetical protein
VALLKRVAIRVGECVRYIASSMNDRHGCRSRAPFRITPLDLLTIKIPAVFLHFFLVRYDISLDDFHSFL